jgi:MFS family permease
MRIIAQGWLVYDLTGSKAILGTVTAAGLLPFVLLSPFGGLVADRYDRRRVLIVGDAIAVLANLVLAILILTEVVTVLQVVIIAVVVGATRAVEIPVRNAFVRNLVTREEMTNAIALNAAGFNVARVVGPAVGGLLLVHVGMGECFLVVALLGSSLIVALSGLRVPYEDVRVGTGSAWRQIAEGFRYVRGHRRTRTLLLLLAISLICTWTYQTLMPAFARDRLHMGEGGFGMLMAVAGAGALLGALWVAGRVGTLPARRNVVFGLVWTGTFCVGVLAFATHLAVVLPALLGAGFCQVAFMATANGMVQESVPDALRGRVMGIWTFTFGSAFPLGSLLMGWVSQGLGIRAAWAGGAVLTVLLTAAVRMRLPSAAAAAAEAAADREARDAAAVTYATPEQP